MLQTFELLDRFELLYPTKSKIADLRRAYIDKDFSSLFRLLPKQVSGDIEDLRKAVIEQNIHSVFRLVDDEDLRKLILEDNTWKLWPLLDRYVDTQFVAAFKNFYINETEIWNDCFSRGQLESKIWLVNKLKELDLELGTVFLCAGWYATLATMLFESGIKIDKIRSFDFDDSCYSIAETFNKPWVKDEWRFKACTQDIFDIDFNLHTYIVKRSDGSTCDLTESPDTIINTSCEHIDNFQDWYSKIPDGKLVILQSNDYFEIKEHVNCVKDIYEFKNMAPMSELHYMGFRELPKYKRFMLIGYK